MSAMRGVITEYDNEPVRGLPTHLPQGEAILWQGSPRWQVLAVRAFHIRTLAAYFAVLLVMAVTNRLLSGADLLGVLKVVGWVVPLSAAALALVALYSWLTARSTVYTITSRRVVMRFGIALPMSFNLPFAMIESAALRGNPDDSGDIALTLVEKARMAYLVMWPHAQPWKLGRTRPMLRGLPDATTAARVLAQALAAAVPGTSSVPVRMPKARDHHGLAAATA